jgi:carbon-monoxide dehydrogenase medium subunit
MLAEMEEVLGSVQIRNWGTIGGDLCHADPAGDPGTVLIALGAKIKARSPRGQREVPISDFFVDYLETVLEPDEILEELWLPYLPPHSAGVYFKESVRFGDFPFVSVAAVVTLDNGAIKDARIALGAVAETPIRAKKAEAAIIGKKVGESLGQIGEAAAEEARPQGDVSGSAEYKREMVRIVTNLAVTEALKRAQAK